MIEQIIKGEEVAATSIENRLKLSEQAYYGLAGEITKALSPYTEASPVAILVQILVLVVMVVGRSGCWWVGGTAHYLNQYILLVGSTALGRKGTSTNVVKHLLQFIAPDFCKGNFVSGIGSGEGIINRLRDSREKIDPKTQKPIIDEGIADKRLVAIEEEFSSILIVARRESSILSATLRAAWDGKDLQTVVKNDPLYATEPFLSLIGHITPREFSQLLTDLDINNGLLNRFIFLFVEKSKDLPFGGKIPSEIIEAFVPRLLHVISFGRGVEEMGFTSKAAELWDQTYRLANLPQGNEDHAAITARNLPIIRRLACAYAIFDLKKDVDYPHLLAAIAIADYSSATCKVLLSKRKDKAEQKILHALRNSSEGISRTSLLKEVLKKNVPSEKLTEKLENLAKEGAIRKVSDYPETWKIADANISAPPYDPTTFTTFTTFTTKAGEAK